MEPLPGEISQSPVKLRTPEEIFRAKAERRKRLAALSLTEKVRIMEKLQAAGRTLRAARTSLRSVKPPP